MEFANDDLESNPFFNELQTKYAAKYKEAQKHLWLICVPVLRSLKGVIITKEFVDFHVLRPSPFFKSHYVTTDENNSVCIEMEDSTLKTPSNVIRILMEETAYNEHYKPYKVLIIEKPLSCSSKNNDEADTDEKSRKGYILSLKECTIFLESLPGCSRRLELLDKKLHAFNSSYMVLPHYLQDAVIKLQNIRHWAVEEIQQAVSYSSPHRFTKAELSIALENYIMCNVHDKLFPVIKKHCLEEDKKLTKKLLSLYEASITPDQLGVGETFCCQTPSAVVELASLNSRCSPAEKLHCLMTTLELLNQDVEKYLSETCFVVSSNKDLPHLTSDDLIPLLVNVIIQARPQYFVSNLYYIQNFCWEMSSVDKFSFGLVTFQAAKEFVMSNEFNFPEPSTRKVKKELSLEELMEATVEIHNNAKFSSENKPTSNQTPIDHQLENVTKMIEASTRDLQDKTHFKDTLNSRDKHIRPKQVKQEENLGDFITSLRLKSLGLTYGKQS